jgi:hypothetical protein
VGAANIGSTQLQVVNGDPLKDITVLHAASTTEQRARERWYAVYFLGPDKLKFEVVHQPSTVRRYGELMRLVAQVMKH